MKNNTERKLMENTLKKAEKELIKYQTHLEKMVEERTAELKDINEKLKKEIVEHKKTEGALQANESDLRKLFEEYYTLLEAIPDELLLLTTDRKILWANSVAFLRYGKKNLLLGRECREFFNCTIPCDTCPVGKSFSSGKTETGQILTKDNKFFDIKVSPIKNKNEKVTKVILVASDVTEKMNLHEEAIRRSHLASIGELAAGVAHEINNPINGIINYAQIIADKIKKDSTEKEIAGEIIKEGKRIATIVNSLLSFSRGGSPEKAPVSINEIFASSLSLSESQILKDGIKIKVNIPENLPMIIAQSSQIQQVFMNLLSNARYAVNKKYPVGKAYDDKIIEILLEEIHIDNIPWLKISFYDHGCGVPKNIIDKIITPFFSTKPLGQGTGLGLSISYGIIVDHGGKITIESVEGEFTEVIITLPVWTGKEINYPGN